MNKLHVKKNDVVMVISGKDAGKKGKVLVALPDSGRVVVEGVNMVSKHVRPRSATQQGGRITQEGPIYASKVMLMCGKCNKPTRVAHKTLEGGSRVRVCKHCGEVLD